MVSPLHGAPVNAVFARPWRAMPPRRRCCGDVLPAGAVMPEARTHITMITLSPAGGQGLKLRAPGTYGHSTTPEDTTG